MHKETRLKRGSRFTPQEINRIRKEGKIVGQNTFTAGGTLFDQIIVMVPDEED